MIVTMCVIICSISNTDGDTKFGLISLVTQLLQKWSLMKENILIESFNEKSANSSIHHEHCVIGT